jgi:hypothetical protein
LLKRYLVPRRIMATIAVSLVALLALPMVVLATTSDAIAQTGGMTATLPLLGSSLTVEVTLDGTGNLSKVNLDPVGTSSASKLSAHAVTFDSADGTTQVKIKATGDKLSIKASAGTLDAIVGPGTWSADVFGTGSKSTVAYTVGKAADGSPTLTLGTVNAASGIAVAAGTPQTGSHEQGASASVKVAFSRDGYTKTLSIRVSVKAKGSHPASLQISLSGKDRQMVSGALADLVGPHTWSGKACDGTAVAITYTVLADGTVVYGSATGGTATVKTRDHGFAARFDGTKLKVQVSLKQAEDGAYSLSTSAKRGGCLHQGVPLPTVNAPVKPGADQQGYHKRDSGHKASDSGNGSADHKGGGSGSKGNHH